jgi:four helix bundle protein
MELKNISGVKSLIVYQKAFELAMNIFNISKKFPSDEKFALISQIRRSSRSVCLNLAEGYRKRIYQAHFIAKISDADMENTETETWIDFALACEYITENEYKELIAINTEISKMIYHMLTNPEKYLSINQKINLQNSINKV